MPQQRGRAARMLSKKQQWRKLCMTRCTREAATNSVGSPPPTAEEHARAGPSLARGALERLGAGVEEGSEGGSDSGGSEEDGQRSSRSVSFDETARVVFVPTRHELLALGYGDCAPNGGSPREEGLWWTRQDCSQFRRSFRRQIFAQGLQKSCTSLLMKDKMVHKIDRDQVKNPEEEEGGGADAGNGAGAGGDGQSGACSTSCGSPEISTSPSPSAVAEFA